MESLTNIKYCKDVRVILLLSKVVCDGIVIDGLTKQWNLTHV